MLLVSLMNYFSFFNLGIELRKSRLTEVTILFNASKLISNQKACFLFLFLFSFLSMFDYMNVSHVQILLYQLYNRSFIITPWIATSHLQIRLLCSFLDSFQKFERSSF